MRTKIKMFSLGLLVMILLCIMVSCEKKIISSDIVILYTNDVHCKIDEKIGYAGLASYKNYVKTKTDYVTLVDCGDAIQGDAIGTISKGELIIDLMNEVGYDYAILGNHEFDYGIDQLSNLINKSKATYLGCNLEYSGTKTNKLSNVKRYEIKEYDDKKIAYIGVSTPDTLVSSNPISFKEDNEFVYGFFGETNEKFYNRVQDTIDECKNKGADYVVILSHLGDEAGVSGITSMSLIENTKGIDVCLDAHSHHAFSTKLIESKDKKKVLLSQTGTQLDAIGQLVITHDGFLTTSLITDYSDKDTKVNNKIEEVRKTCNEILKEKIATSDISLSIADTEGVRMVRNRETTIGSFCADAYRLVTEADIACVNGGGIRASLPQGEITYEDIIAIHPFGNMICVVEATGQEILDMLEVASRNTELVYKKDGLAFGENGGFLQVSGIKYTIDTSIKSSVVFDEKGFFKEINGKRRVCDVYVLSGNDYTLIDVNKTYTLASNNYIIKNGGDGINMFMDNKLIQDETLIDNQVLITYIRDILGGKVGDKYSTTQNRITIK